MNQYISTILICIVVVATVIILYYSSEGILPGSRLIVQDIPVDTNKIDATHARFIFFYVTWCPYSVTARDIWDSFKQSMRNNPKTYGGKTIEFEEVNCETQKGKAALYGIKHYPTFKVQTDKKVYEMLGKPSINTFRNFLIAALGKESS